MATATTTALERKPTLPAPVVVLIRGLTPSIPSLLPADIPMEQFRAALYLELTGRPDLHECTQESLRDCVVKSATYGLLPGRDCHFLPFRNKRKGGKKDATYVPNYFGIILALERSGKVRRAFAHPVYEGDEWGFDYFADRPIHKPALSLGKEQGKILFYYGAIMLKDNTCHFEVLTLKDIEAVKKRAPAHEDGPWMTDPVMMARKTAIKRVAKYVKLSPAFQEMVAEDEAREREDISQDRHAQNITDLFGENADTSISAHYSPSTATAPQTYTADPDTGELLEDNLPEQGMTLPPGTDPGWWRDILETHKDDKALPEDLRAKVKLALNPRSETPHSKGMELASAVLDWLPKDDKTTYPSE